MERRIIHLNIADFSVAVERVLDTNLKGKPLIIADPSPRAVVFDMSDEAYGDGVRKGMPLATARHRCRSALVLPPRPEQYRKVLHRCLEHALHYTPLVERSHGTGHLYLDVTGTHRLFGPAPDIGWRLRNTLRRDLGLDPIWSLGSNKLVAKVASRLVKPRGEYIVGGGEEMPFLAPIRNKKQIVGLLHFNDRRKGCFAPESIAALEGIAAHIGAALMRKQAEDILQEERKRLRDIVEFLPDATLAIDREGHVIIWNKAMEEMTGVPAATMIGRGGYCHAIPLYGEARPILIDLVLEENQETTVRYPHLTRQGDALMAEVFCHGLYGNKGAWGFAKASPLRDQEGNVVGAIESIRDITQSKRAAQEKKSLQAQLIQAQKMEALGTLAGGIAHDFNNILSGILGFADLARTKTLDLPVVHEYVGEILAAGTRATDLIRQILTFSRRLRSGVDRRHHAPHDRRQDGSADDGRPAGLAGLPHDRAHPDFDRGAGQGPRISGIVGQTDPPAGTPHPAARIVKPK